MLQMWNAKFYGPKLEHEKVLYLDVKFIYQVIC